MNPISTLIVDDESLAREGIRHLLQDDPTIQIIGEASQGLQAQRLIQAEKPELVFLDIRMPDCDGFEVLAGLSGTLLPVVVFTTAYDQFAIRAFEAHAVDYLLKPYDDQRFLQALTHAKHQVKLRRIGQAHSQLNSFLEEQTVQWVDGSSASYPKRIAIKRANGTEFIHIETIDWIGAADYYAEIHLGSKQYLVRESLQSLAKKLDPSRFVRIHRSSIVNIERVCGLQTNDIGEPQVRLSCGRLLRVSRPGRTRLNNMLQLL